MILPFKNVVLFAVERSVCTRATLKQGGNEAGMSCSDQRTTVKVVRNCGAVDTARLQASILSVEPQCH